MTASVTIMDKFKLTTLTFPCLPSFCLVIYLLQSCWLFLLNIRSVTPLSHSGSRIVRQSQNGTSLPDPSNTSHWFASNWPWIVLLVLLILASCTAVICLLLCCVLRHSHNRAREVELNHTKKSHFQSDSHLLNHTNSPQKLSSRNSSSTCVLEVNGIGDCSACASSLQSYEKIRKKHSSPGHSSGSEDGLKVQPGVERTGGNGRFSKRRSGSLVHVSLCDESDLSMISVPSMTSVETTQSVEQNYLETPKPAVIEVNITLPTQTSERESQITTAAALAESAAKLAQSAANIGDQSDDMWQKFQKKNGEWMMRFRTTSSCVPGSGTSPYRVQGQYTNPRPEHTPTPIDNHHDPLYHMRVSGNLYGNHSRLPSRAPSQNGTVSPLKILTHSQSGHANYQTGGSSPGSPHISRHLSYHYSDLDRPRISGQYGSCSPKRRSGPLNRGSSSFNRPKNYSPSQELRPLSKRSHDEGKRRNTQSKDVSEVDVFDDTSLTRSWAEPSVNHPTLITEPTHLRHQSPSTFTASSITTGKDKSTVVPESLLQSQQSSSRVQTEVDVKSHRTRRPSVPSLISNSGVVENMVSSSKSASTDNLHAKLLLQCEEKELSSSVSRFSSQLKRQASMPNFKYAGHTAPSTGTPVETSVTTPGVKQSNHSLTRTVSGLSLSCVESANSGYLASEGSSLTLDVGGRESMISQMTIGSGYTPYLDHSSSCNPPSSPSENGIDIDMLVQLEKKRSARVSHKDEYSFSNLQNDSTPPQSPLSDFHSQTPSTDGVEV